MKYIKTVKSYKKLALLIALGLGIGSTQISIAKNIIIPNYTLPLDSIGNEIINGNRFVIHQLKAKETYYQLNRIYGVPVKEIMDANSNKSLRLGDNVKIPRGKALVIPEASKKETKNKPALINPQDITEYKVGKSETLYSISRRFRISVEDIKKVNGLTSDILKEGLILKIPNTSLPAEPEEPKVIILPEVIEENQPIDDSFFKPNKYGISEKKERGVGVWLDSLTGDGQTSLALHKTAPIGTILKIMNPMNQSVTFAKVVGKFGDNEDTQGAIVVLSKSAATSIGVLDKKFQIEITYGIPLD